MRNNLPITQQEYAISDGQVLVSETDVHGNIIYANEAFIATSGYTWEELVGQPHNIVRHPDVPSAVFKDLWETLKEGEPWHQFLKNRRKNGDYYWVEANVAPVMHEGKVTGYKSVRNVISSQQVKATETLYRDLVQGKAVLNRGSVTTPLAIKMAALSPLPKKSILGKTMIPLIIMAVMWSIVLQLYLQNVADNLYEEAVHDRQQLLSSNLDSEIASQSQIALTNAVGLAGNSALIYGLYDHQKTVIWQILQINYEQYVKRANMEGMGLAVFDEKMQLLSNSGVSIQVESMPTELITRVVFQAEGGFLQALVPVLYGPKTIGLVVVSLPLTQLAALEAQANHQYAAFEFSKNAWQSTKGFEQTPAAQNFELLTQAQQQQLTTKGFLIKDQSLYVWSSISAEDKVTGAHLIVEPMAILSQLLRNTYFMIYVAQGAMSGGFILLLVQVFWRMRKFILTPLKNLTDKLEIASEQGSLSVRAETLSADEIGLMGKSFNHYVTSVQHLMISVSDMIDELSKGRLSTRIKADAKGDLNTLKNYVNNSADKIQTVIKEIEKAIYSIKVGQYSYQSTQHYQGEFGQMIKDLKDAMHSTQTAVSGINATMQAISQGNFSLRLTADLQGELAVLKSKLNETLDQLESGISETVDVLVVQSKGDLTQRVQGHYQGDLGMMAQALNTSLDNSAHAITELKSASNTVNEASAQIADGSANLSDRIQTQAATLQETVTNMDGITERVRKNAENAAEASVLASTAKQQADNGSNVMLRTKDAMDKVSQSSQKIADIISLIDSIAFQTNLLALNAAVEAARAGEQGRGFAVVAGEVRNLAGKSSEAAKEIRHLIESTTHQVRDSVNLVESSSQEFTSIVSIILQMHAYVEEIAQASQEQASSVGAVAHAMEAMDQVTQQNASLVAETAAAAQTLRNEADEMGKQVSFFNTNTKATKSLPKKT